MRKLWSLLGRIFTRKARPCPTEAVRQAALRSKGPIFWTLRLPGGRTIQCMREDVYQRALKAASRAGKQPPTD